MMPKEYHPDWYAKTECQSFSGGLASPFQGPAEPLLASMEGRMESSGMGFRPRFPPPPSANPPSGAPDVPPSGSSHSASLMR